VSHYSEIELVGIPHETTNNHSDHTVE
jgi:hypothetical protein